MSNYRAKAFNPVSGLFEDADYLDDYYGKHKYGIRFADGCVHPQAHCGIDAVATVIETLTREKAELEAEVDRFRRGWGPSTPTTHQKRHDDLWHARCYLDRAYGAMVELNTNNYTHDDVEASNAGTIEAFDHIKEGQKFINDRLVEISKGITERPDEAMTALEARAEASESTLREALDVVRPFAEAIVTDSGEIIGLQRNHTSAARAFIEKHSQENK